MRPLLILIAALIAAPAYSQRVFRASSLEEANEQLETIDRRVKNLDKDVRYKLSLQDEWITQIGTLQSHAEQDRYRTEKAIESLTKRMETLESSVADRVSLPDPVPDPVPNAPVAETSGGELAVAPKQPASVRPSPLSTLQTERFTTSELRQMIRQVAPDGWLGAADVSPQSNVKQHLTGAEHGFSWDQVAGLSHDDAMTLHDLAPGHENKIYPTRSQQLAAHRRDHPQPTQPPAEQPQGLDCANGQCATQTTIPRGNFPRFRLFK